MMDNSHAITACVSIENPHALERKWQNFLQELTLGELEQSLLAVNDLKGAKG